jgi:hypothetical protein
MQPRFIQSALIATALSTLASCGGGGDASTSPINGNTPAGTSAEGFYSGSLTGSLSNNFEMLVLENDEVWVLHGNQTTAGFSVNGFVQGAGKSNNGSYSATDIRDFGFAPAMAVSASASYRTADKTISGSIVEGNSTATFSGGTSPAVPYSYATAATLASITGSWTLAALTGESVAVDITSAGALSARSSQGCSFTGTLTPRASGKNVFNVALKFGASPCLLPNQNATGIAINYPLSNGKTQLIVAGYNTERTLGTVAFGTR